MNMFYIQEGITALMFATEYGYKGVVKALLERRANPNITNKVNLCLILGNIILHTHTCNYI